MDSPSYDEIIQQHEWAQWTRTLNMSQGRAADIGSYFAVISLTGDVHHATNLSRLRGRWTAVLADTGEPAFITHVRKAPMSLREIEELRP